MPRKTMTAKTLAATISKIRAERQAHLEAVAEIDALLDRLGIAATEPKRRGRPPGRKPGRKAAVKTAPAKRKRARRHYATTAPQSILAFVKKAGKAGATSAEISKHWKSEKRSGQVFNTLGELVKTKKLKKEPLKGQKGSRYTVS